MNEVIVPERKYRFHIIGLQHYPVSEKYLNCAFTQKIVKMSKMMLSLGHEVYIYGAEGSDAPCTEFIQTHTLQDIRDNFGDGKTDNELGYDWETGGFDEQQSTIRSNYGIKPKFIQNCINEIRARKKEDDFLLSPIGILNRSIIEGVGLRMSLESGIGYTNSFAPFRAYESNFIRNLTYGKEFGGILRPNHLDRTIPNYFEDKDFDYKEEKQEYLLYLGRLTYAKGVTVAIETAKKLGYKIIIAGVGVKSWDAEKKRLIGTEFDITSDNIEFFGYANKQMRRMLMSNAKAVFVPSLYSEPFGGTNIEAQLSGTPVLCTNWGAFPETVKHGETGFLCNNVGEFEKYAKRVGELDPKKIRAHAERYLMDNVKYEYQQWFDDIYNKVFN